MEDLPMFDTLLIKSSIRDYSVHFTNEASQSLDKLIEEGDYIIIDKLVLELNPNLKSAVERFGRFIPIEAKESTKSYEGVIPIIDEFIKNGFKRNNRLIAIGGGVTQDATAFISSILYRGVNWIFLPTTLLAQGDSCIGSKTSINFRTYKNQIGNFNPPLSIHLDVTFLRTLTGRDIRSGIGEMAHYFFVAGPKEVHYFSENFETALKDQSNLRDLINHSLSIKKRYIEIDEFDKKERLVFNYGHTFGHAIESVTNYEVPHGVAVSFGMDMANYISLKKGYITQSDFESARSVFSKIWQGYSIKDLNINGLFSAMSKDKKNEDGKFGLILTKGWGNMFKDLTDPDARFKEWMSDYMDKFQRGQ